MRRQPDKFALGILSALFITPRTAVHDALKQQRRAAEKGRLQTDERGELSGPNARLTPSGERTVLGWIGAKKREATPLRLEKFAAVRLFDCRNDLEKTPQWEALVEALQKVARSTVG